IADIGYFYHTLASAYLAEMYLVTKDIDKAQSVVSEAERYIMEKFEAPQLVFKSKLDILKAEILRINQNFEESESYLKKVLIISDETKNPLLKAWVYEQKARNSESLGQFQLAKDNLIEAKRIYEELGAEKKIRKINELINRS
ncbi:MAG: tetratricopeptide repeat protein, partial [Candidatus Omnitrophica bacterium]|nr:tetratricopeptide repeat protein [Candidatus Omnitrophota bacterium]